MSLSRRVSLIVAYKPKHVREYSTLLCLQRWCTEMVYIELLHVGTQMTMQPFYRLIQVKKFAY